VMMAEGYGKPTSRTTGSLPFGEGWGGVPFF
jgi:hypothetical protein